MSKELIYKSCQNDSDFFCFLSIPPNMSDLISQTVVLPHLSYTTLLSHNDNYRTLLTLSVPFQLCLVQNLKVTRLVQYIIKNKLKQFIKYW